MYAIYFIFNIYLICNVQLTTIIDDDIQLNLLHSQCSCTCHHWFRHVCSVIAAARDPSSAGHDDAQCVCHHC